MEDRQKRSLGAVVRTLREAAGISRQELVERTAPTASERVSLEMLAKIEQGKKAPSASTLRKLATGLGLEPTDLSSTAAWWEHKELEGASGALLRLGVTQALALSRQLPQQGLAGRALFTGAVGAAVPVIGAGAVGALAAALGYGAWTTEVANREAIIALLHERVARLSEGTDQEVEVIAQALGVVVPEQGALPGGGAREGVEDVEAAE